MSTDLPQPTESSQALAAGSERVQHYIQQSMSENTRRAYKSDWACFTDWCEGQNFTPLPATSEAVADYISALALGDWGRCADGYAASTIERRLTTIRVIHRARGHDDPTQHELVAKARKGLRNDDDVQVAQEGRRALLSEDVRAMVDALDTETTKGKRDAAILLVGLATGMRRSELAGLDVDDVEFRARGVVLHIQQSKTDQEGKGRAPYITHGGEFCPVEALQDWIDAADIDNGPLFRTVGRWGNARDNRMSGKSINRAVKSAAEPIEHLDETELGAHSLRAGHVTQRKIEGESNDAIMDQTGHASESTMRRYDRRAKQFRHDVTGSLGL